jgi:hypothetical protein
MPHHLTHLPKSKLREQLHEGCSLFPAVILVFIRTPSLHTYIIQKKKVLLSIDTRCGKVW